MKDHQALIKQSKYQPKRMFTINNTEIRPNRMRTISKLFKL